MSEEKELTNEERAKLLFERGQKGFENNNFLEALHYFKLSNKLQKTFQTDEYIKKCEEKVKEIREKEKEKEQKQEESGEKPKNTDDEACENIINNKDYYNLLGVTKETNNDDIKRAYKKLAIKFHPDKNKSSKAEEAFKKIATAYQTLTDPKKRELYDKYGTEEEYREKVCTYYNCMIDEKHERLKEIWEMFLQMEIGQLHAVKNLFEKHEKRDAEEVIGNKIVLPCRFMSQKEYVTQILTSQIQKRVTSDKGYCDIKDLPEDWASYEIQKELNKDGSPTENVIQIMKAAKGRDLVIADENLKKQQAKLLEKGLQEKCLAPDTVTVDDMKEMMKEEEIEHKCE